MSEYLKSPHRFKINKDYSRDNTLPEISLKTLNRGDGESYLLKSEKSPQDLFERVACYFADSQEHAQRLYDYMSLQYFCPATPILTNANTNRGLCISCFLNEVQDNLKGIFEETLIENVHLASNGGGIGTYYGNVRSTNEQVRVDTKSSGIIPFIKVNESASLAVSQGSLRRGSTAIYLHISHPEIDEFIELRRSTGDEYRRTKRLHHGVVIDDKFMKCVEQGSEYELLSPKSNKVISKVNARELFIKLINTRVETGEPYILYIDNVNKTIPQHHRDLGLQVKTSNLCSEITLPTGKDYLDKVRTAVCCLSSINLEKWDNWSTIPEFIPDILRFLDNVLQDFIENAPNEFKNAKYSAMMERSVGLGAMGWHSFLQSKMIPFESVVAKSWNNKIFKYIKDQCDAANIQIGKEKGCNTDYQYWYDKVGGDHSYRRFSNITAVAPTSSISKICGGVSPSIEPTIANVYVDKSLAGSTVVVNPYLKKLIESKCNGNIDAINNMIKEVAKNEGSIQNMDQFSDDEKLVFKTAFEIDQLWVIDHASDRVKYIDQASSNNLFFKFDCTKDELLWVHYEAWKKGIKSLYYCRSQSVGKLDKVSNQIKQDNRKEYTYEECVACT